MDASAISTDNYGMELMQATVAKKAQDQNAQMAAELIQDTVQTNSQILASGVHANAASANPGDRVGTHINIAV